jgi:disulfide bond formation protein DsbB
LQPGFLARVGPRGWNLLGALACAALIGYALYSEHVLGYMPCPLCMFQRVGVIALGAVFLIAALHAPRGRGRYVYAALAGTAALATAGIAARHVYIQTLPPGTVPACGAPLDVMLQFLPFFEVVKNVLTASGECGNVDWAFLGLSMPAWVLLASLAMGVFGVFANTRQADRSLSSTAR